MEKIPASAPAIKTVGELIKQLSQVNPELPVSLMIEFSGQWEDNLREVITLKDRVVLMGLERIDPEYEALNPK